MQTYVTDGIRDSTMMEVVRAVRDGSPDSQLTHILFLIFHLERGVIRKLKTEVKKLENIIHELCNFRRLRILTFHKDVSKIGGLVLIHFHNQFLSQTAHKGQLWPS